MAQRTIVELTDDMTGEPADESITFAIEGKSYAIDLSSKNADKLRKALAPYISAGRKDVAGGGRPGKATRTSGSTGHDPAAVRAWAASNGYQVSSRGRVSRELVDAYQAAGN